MMKGNIRASVCVCVCSAHGRVQLGGILGGKLSSSLSWPQSHPITYHIRFFFRFFLACFCQHVYVVYSVALWTEMCRAESGYRVSLVCLESDIQESWNVLVCLYGSRQADKSQCSKGTSYKELGCNAFWSKWANNLIRSHINTSEKNSSKVYARGV